MDFCWLKNPVYITDQAESAANPIEEVERVVMPGVVCSVCGSSWAGNRKLYLQLPPSPLWQQMTGCVLPEHEWNELAAKVRDAGRLPPEFELQPGDKLSVPTYEIKRSHLKDFLHPFPGTLIAKAGVVSILTAAEVTGFDAVLVKSHFGHKVRTTESIDLYALKIKGEAWHPGVTEQSTETCSHCHRAKSPMLDWHSVDEQRWDKSDMMYVDLNPNMVIVTKRVCDVLQDAELSNWHCA